MTMWHSIPFKEEISLTYVDFQLQFPRWPSRVSTSFSDPFDLWGRGFESYRIQPLLQHFFSLSSLVLSRFYLLLTFSSSGYKRKHHGWFRRPCRKRRRCHHLRDPMELCGVCGVITLKSCKIYLILPVLLFVTWDSELEINFEVTGQGHWWTACNSNASVLKFVSII